MKSIICAILMATLPLAAEAQDNGCQNSMKARVYEIKENSLHSEGEAVIRRCDGLFITFLATNKTVNAVEVFASAAGLGEFVSNLDAIAMVFVPPPTEFLGKGWPFQIIPKLTTISADHSDLAVGLGGGADTVVFKFTKESPIMLLQIYETSGVWFGQASYSTN